MKILVVNAGSSSFKLALYDLKNAFFLDDTSSNPIWEGILDLKETENSIKL